MIVKPSPRSAGQDIVHGPFIETVPVGNSLCRHRSLERSDLSDASRAEAGPYDIFALVNSTVLLLVRFIVSLRLPRQVARIYAAKMTVSAGVRSFMLGAWRRSVDRGTGEARNNTPLVLNGDLPVPLPAPCERPDKTFFAGPRNDRILVERDGSTPLGLRFPTAERIAVSSPAMIVRIAPSECLCGLAAAINRAYAKFSHLDLLTGLGWSERVVGRHAFGALAIFTGSVR